MRHALPTALFAALLASAPVAAAQDFALGAVTFSPELQMEFANDFGVRESPVLVRAVEHALSSEMARRGHDLGASAAVTIEVTIVDAAPNRPTMEQLVDRPGLSLQSISTGGAEIKATIRDADGRILAEVEHRRFDQFEELTGAESTWSSARRAIRQWAHKVATAYEANV
jgi:hypothetical protein